MQVTGLKDYFTMWAAIYSYRLPIIGIDWGAGDRTVIKGDDWAFAYPAGYALDFIQWRHDQPPRIFMRSALGERVVYCPKVIKRG